jgi:hypothetical protein
MDNRIIKQAELAERGRVPGWLASEIDECITGKKEVLEEEEK